MISDSIVSYTCKSGSNVVVLGDLNTYNINWSTVCCKLAIMIIYTS